MKKIKFIETSGNKIKHILVKSDPWEGINCECEECDMCHSGDNKKVGKCTKEGVLYELKCPECGLSYFGESSRSIFECHVEHKKGQENEDSKNALWKHDNNDHNKNKKKYEVKIIGYEKNPMK